MRPSFEDDHAVIRQPLAWIHPQRFALSDALDTPTMRAHINRLLCEQSPSLDDLPVGEVARLWLANWPLLPCVASLIGTRLAWPHLAAGGRATRLCASHRAFAGYAQVPWLDPLQLDDSNLGDQLQALGLHALLAFHDAVPGSLCERLLLQFSLSVVARQRDLSSIPPNTALLKLAIQHARFYPNPD